MDDNMCSICYEELGINNKIECVKTCHKNFHKECMEIWLQHGVTCPNCRTEWSENNEIDNNNNNMKDRTFMCFYGADFKCNKLKLLKNKIFSSSFLFLFINFNLQFNSLGQSK